MIGYALNLILHKHIPYVSLRCLKVHIINGFQNTNLQHIFLEI